MPVSLHKLSSKCTQKMKELSSHAKSVRKKANSLFNRINFEGYYRKYANQRKSFRSTVRVYLLFTLQTRDTYAFAIIQKVP